MWTVAQQPASFGVQRFGQLLVGMGAEQPERAFAAAGQCFDRGGAQSSGGLRITYQGLQSLERLPGHVRTVAVSLGAGEAAEGLYDLAVQRIAAVLEHRGQRGDGLLLG